MSTVWNIPCPYPTCTISKPCKVLITQHLRFDHVIQSTPLTCKIDNCGMEYGTLSSYRMHLRRQHLLLISSSDDSLNTSNNEELQLSLPEISEGTSSSFTANNFGTNILQEIGCHEFNDRFRQFCVRIKEKHKLSHSTYNSIMTDFVQLLSSCESTEIVESVIPLWKTMSSPKNYADYCKTLGLVSPTTIRLGESSYQYISVVDTLCNYLSHMPIFELIYENSFICNADLNDFTCGTYFINHSFFKGQRDFLRLHLFCDDIEICNALGSSRTKNKLTCIYFFIGNIGPQNYSNLKHIMLAIVVKTKDVHHFGYEKILTPLIRDVQFLEKHGLSVCINHENGLKDNYKFLGTVATLSADNLAAHEVGGFRCCFSSGKFCRYCLCSYEQIKTKFHSFEIRDAATHNSHIEMVQKNPSLVAVYGVKNDCSLHNITGFNASTSLPADIMHDCLEGVIPSFLKLLFSHLISELPGMSISTINQKIRSFKFGVSEAKNKPRCLPHDVVRSNCSLSLSASEAWCLFRVIPLILADYIPVDDAVWSLYTQLSQILQIVFAPKLKKEWIHDLRLLTQKFYFQVMKIAPHILKPKFHFLLHYPDLMEKFGPLRHLWCMRFEAFHTKIKEVSKSSRSFRNICFTVANRIQKVKCWEQSESSYCNQQLLMFGKTKTIEFSSLDPVIQEFVANNFMTLDASINNLAIETASKASSNGLEYAIGGVVIAGMYDSHTPLFGKLLQIMSIQNVLFLHIKMLKVIEFDRHFSCFVVAHTDDDKVILAGCEKSFHCLELYDVQGKSLIRLRYNVF